MRTPTSRGLAGKSLRFESLESRRVLAGDALPEISIADATATEGSEFLRFIDKFVPPNPSMTVPHEILIGPDGYLYVANGETFSTGGNANNFIARYDAQTGAFVDVAFRSGDSGVIVDQPWAMTFGPDNKLYVTSRWSNNVVRYDPATDIVEDFIPAGSGLYTPAGIAFGPDQNLYVTNGHTSDTDTSTRQDQVLRFQGPGGSSPGKFIDVFVRPGNGLDNANAIEFYGDSLYVSSGNSHSVLRYDAISGAYRGVFVQPGNGLNRPSYSAFRPDGYFYVSNHRGDTLQRYNAATGAFVDAVVPLGSGGLDQPAGFVFDEAGNIYLASGITREILRYRPASQAAFVLTLSAASSAPVTVNYATVSNSAVAGSDFAATSGTLTFAPGQISRTILVQTIDDDSVEPSETFSVVLSNATGAMIADGQATGTIQDDDASRKISISDATAVEGDQELRYIDDFVSANGGGLRTPRGVLIDPSGDYLYVASGLAGQSEGDSSNQILRFNRLTGAFVDVAFTSGDDGVFFDLPWDMTFGPDNKLYVSARRSHNILRYDPIADRLEEFVPADRGVYRPCGVSFGPDGNLYVSNADNGTTSDSSPLQDQIVRFRGPASDREGELIDVFIHSNGLLDNNQPILFHDGYLYIGNYRHSNQGNVLRYTLNGAFDREFIANGSGGLTEPSYLSSNAGNLFVNNQSSGQILEYDASGTFVSRVVDVPLEGATGFAFDDEGNLYVGFLDGRQTSSNADDIARVRRYSPNSLAAFAVTLSATSTEPVTVDFETKDGSALAGQDYVSASGTLTFAPGQTSRTILFPTVNDAAIEPSETFTVTLSAANGAAIADGTGVGTILDDDTKFYVVNDGASASSDRTFEYGTAGAIGENYGFSPGNTAPRGVATTIAGDKTWIVDANRTVYVYDAAGLPLGSWAAGSIVGNGPDVQGVATNGTDVWVVDNRSNRVYRYAGAASRTSGSQTAASNFALAKANANPRDLVTDGTHLWVVDDASTDRVFKYTLSGTLVGSWTITTPGATQPVGITLDAANPRDLWIVDHVTDRVYAYAGAVTRSGGSQTASSSFALANDNGNPQGLAGRALPDLSTLATLSDFNADGHVDGADMRLWQSLFGTTGAAAELGGDGDGDGDVDGADFLLWQRQYSPAPGPFEADGQVDGADLLAWQTAFGATDAGADADGDGDVDGDVDGADFLLWQRLFSPWTDGAGVAAVQARSAASAPEASSADSPDPADISELAFASLAADDRPAERPAYRPASPESGELSRTAVRPLWSVNSPSISGAAAPPPPASPRRPHSQPFRIVDFDAAFAELALREPRGA